MSINPVAAASIIMLVLLFLKVPVFASVFAAAAAYFFLMPDLPQQIVVQRMLAGAESIPMLAIPFFVCAGTFMDYSGVTARVMQFCEVLTGRMTGGLAQVNVLLSTLMGGFRAPTWRTRRWRPRCWCRKWKSAAFPRNSRRS